MSHRLGERFDKRVLKELRQRGIRTKASVSMVHQTKNNRWLIAGTEGGGSANGGIGGVAAHYVGYVNVANSLFISIPQHSLLGNGITRRVFGTDLLRIEAFRFKGSCNLTVTRFYLHEKQPGRRPVMLFDEIFRAIGGVLNEGDKLPVFFDKAAEPMDIPVELQPAMRAAVRAIQTLQNRLSHMNGLSAVNLPQFEVTLEALAQAVPTLDATTESAKIEPAEPASLKVVPNPGAKSRAKRAASSPAA